MLEKIQELEQRIVDLERENVETSNCLYELMNEIDMLKSRFEIDEQYLNEKWKIR